MYIEYLGTRNCHDIHKVYTLVDTPYNDLNLFEVYTYDPVADKLTGNTNLSSRISSIMKRARLFTYLPDVTIEQMIKYKIDGHLIFVYKCINVLDSTNELKYFYLCDYSFDAGIIKRMSRCFRYKSPLYANVSDEYVKAARYSFYSKAFSLDFPYAI